MIKKRTYINGETNIDYILNIDIPEEYKEEFTDWMYGQTMPIIGNEKKGECAIYWHDWERWYQWKTGKTNILILINETI